MSECKYILFDIFYLFQSDTLLHVHLVTFIKYQNTWIRFTRIYTQHIMQTYTANNLTTTRTYKCTIARAYDETKDISIEDRQVACWLI